MFAYRKEKNMILNQEQKIAVEEDGNILVIAGAGSGKTRVLTERVKRLLQKGINPNRIMTVTFTNKAANEMKERIQNDQIKVGTFHNFAIAELAYLFKTKKGKIDENFSVIDEEDSKKLIKNICSSYKEQIGSSGWKEIYYFIKNCKTFGYTPSIPNYSNDVKQRFNSKMSYEMAQVSEKVFKRYQDILLSNNQLDYDDILLYFNAYCRLGILKTDIDYILIDEAQDMNAIQLEMINNIRKPSTIIFAVGDADQAIYKWRGSDSSFFVKELFKNVEHKVVNLSINYRSGEEILNCANNTIKNNKEEYYRSSLKTLNNEETEVVINSYNSDTGENNALCEKIAMLDSLDSSVILYRSATVLPSLKKTLDSCGIPYFLPEDSIGVYEEKNVKLLLKYLRLLIDQTNNLNLFDILNDGKVCPSSSLKKIKEKIYEGDNFNLFEILDDRKEMISLGVGSTHMMLLTGFSMKIKKLLNIVKNPQNVYEFVVEFANSLGIYDSNVEMVLLPLKEFVSNDVIESIKEFLKIVSTEIREKNSKIKSKEGCISVMTCHQAKGLEFDNVFVIGVEEGIFPVNENELEDDRRLLFVAITRAKNYLSISCSKNRMIYGEFKHTGPSKLFLELKKD